MIYCDNDDRHLAAYRSRVLLCGCVFCSCGFPRYSRERSCLVAFRDGSCGNDDVTSDSITLLIRLDICNSGRGAFGGAVVVSTVV